jgi:hypothetical protein
MVLQRYKDDIIIIISYATLEFEEAFKPWIIFQMKRQFFNIIKISSK